jgi:hypothetical protein
MLYRWHQAWQQELENDFLKRALLKLEVQRAQARGNGGKACTPPSQKK